MKGERQIYDIRMHQPRSQWVFIFILIVAMVGFYAGLPIYLKKALPDEPERVPYSHDFRGMNGDIKIDTFQRYDSIVVVLTTEEGREVRLYDPENGELRGTYFGPPEKSEPEMQEENSLQK